MNRQGFTLPETVVAMSLFAVAAVALCQAAVNARNGLMRLEHKDAGHLRIEWIRDDILAITDRATLEEGGEMVFPRHVRKTQKDGEEEEIVDNDITASWEVEIFPTGLLDVHMLEITMTIEDGDELGEPQVESYFVYRPGWYEEGDGRNSLVTEKEQEWERQQMLRGM